MKVNCELKESTSYLFSNFIFIKFYNKRKVFMMSFTVAKYEYTFQNARSDTVLISRGGVLADIR